MILTERFSDALSYAAGLHRAQVRKGTDVPYISHLLTVCASWCSKTAARKQRRSRRCYTRPSRIRAGGRRSRLSDNGSA